MSRVTVIQVIYNNRQFIEPVFSAIFNQTHKDFNVVAVISGNDDGGKELLAEKFPQAKSRTVSEFLQNSGTGTGMEIIDPGYNIGFAAGHNLVFEKYGSPSPSEERGRGEVAEFFQLVNPDLILEPNYVEQMLIAFNDPKVGAATGKLYQIDRLMIERGAPSFRRSDVALREVGAKRGPGGVLDTTGVTISKSGRARDRGQHEVDRGQYDKDISIQAVSAAGAMYRNVALQATSYKLQAAKEYFDEDFHSYWEDVDLSWRMSNAGWKNIFVPSAIGYHGRGAGSSEKGYTNVVGFIRHHKKLSPLVRQLNYQNHLFLYIKNAQRFYPQFFVREFFMLVYILFFEISTFRVIPRLIKLLPKMWRKRLFNNRSHAANASRPGIAGRPV